MTFDLIRVWSALPKTSIPKSLAAPARTLFPLIRLSSLSELETVIPYDDRVLVAGPWIDVAAHLALDAVDDRDAGSAGCP